MLILLVWLSRKDLSSFNGSDGETSEVGQTGSHRVVLHPVVDAISSVDSVDLQDAQEVVPCFDGVQ